MTPQNDYDVLYETIANRIIRKFDPTDVKHMPKKYKPRNATTAPIFTINPSDYSPDLLKKMEANQIWQDILGHVSPETYTARIILYVNSKRPLPLFCSKDTFRITHIIKELESKYISEKTREELINHFCKFKQTYWAFAKLARIWKIKHTPTRIQTDLYMNELDPTNPRTFQLIHPSGLYLFSLQNLARIIVDAITHQSGMFVEPLPVKNPYTNGLLSKCDLVNIYLSLKHNHLRVHEMLEKFFRCEFNIFEFRRKHETELRDLAIEQYANTASPAELAQDVDDMLRMHKMTKRINIAQGFPQKNLVETMRPLLRIYLLERFSFSSMTRKYASRQLDLALNQFAEKNPIYGRRMTSEFVAPPNSNPFSPTEEYIKTSTKYVTETAPYTGYCKSNYMETHIYNDDMFDRYIETGDSMKTYIMSEPQTPTNQYAAQEDDEDVEWDDSPSHSQTNIVSQINQLSNMQLNAAALYVEVPSSSPPRTSEQVYENTRAILERLGRTTSASIALTGEIQNNIYMNNNVIVNDVNIQNSYANIIADAEEEEEEEEEVIQNPESDDNEETEWENQANPYLDAYEYEEEEEDSVS